MYSRSCGAAFSFLNSSHVPVRAVLDAATRRPSSGAPSRAHPRGAVSPRKRQSRPLTAAIAGSCQMHDVRKTTSMLACRATSAPNRRQRIVGDCEISFGVTPAPIFAKSYPPGSPEGLMHGGVAIEPKYHHVKSAVFNSATGVRVTNTGMMTEMWARDLRYVPVQRKVLQPTMIGGDMTCGNCLHMSMKRNYESKVCISPPVGTTRITALNCEK